MGLWHSAEQIDKLTWLFNMSGCSRIADGVEQIKSRSCPLQNPIICQDLYTKFISAWYSILQRRKESSQETEKWLTWWQAMWPQDGSPRMEAPEKGSAPAHPPTPMLLQGLPGNVGASILQSSRNWDWNALSWKSARGQEEGLWPHS